MANYRQRRLALHEELEELEDCKAYFQPPTNIEMIYPCFVYHRIPGRAQHADNKTYRYSRCWEVTFITTDPLSTVREDMLDHFPTCRQLRDFTADNLYHHVFNLFY